MSERNLYFEKIRGLCICAVILIHCHPIGRNGFEEYYQIVMRQLVDFAVTVFIFLRGTLQSLLIRGSI